MNIKKILAATAASVLAVSAMSVVAFAETDGVATLKKVTMYDAAGNVVKEQEGDLSSKTGNAEETVNFDVSFEGLTEDQVKSITKIEAVLSTTGDFVNGCIGYNKLGTWTSVKTELKADAAPAEGTWSIDVTAGDLASVDDDGNLAPFVQVQMWWVNPEPEADNATTGDDNATTGGDTESKPADDASKPDDNKGNVDTGVAGIAAVVGVAVVAAGAMVVAKKRK